MKIDLEEITIYEIELFYKQIILYLKNLNDNKLLLDFAQVERIDLCAIQVFLALKKYCDNSKISLEFVNIDSLDVKQSIKTYKLEKLFGIEK